jgi:hypothetical protein
VTTESNPAIFENSRKKIFKMDRQSRKSMDALNSKAEAETSYLVRPKYKTPELLLPENAKVAQAVLSKFISRIDKEKLKISKFKNCV